MTEHPDFFGVFTAHTAGLVIEARHAIRADFNQTPTFIGGGEVGSPPPKGSAAPGWFLGFLSYLSSVTYTGDK